MPLSPATASLYVPQTATILAVDELTPNEKLFRLRLDDGQALAHQPGQFVQLSLLGLGEAPLSVASSPTRGPDFELGVRRAGTLTSALHRLAPGASVGIRGPFGHPFEVAALRGQDLVLIAGGCGLAPLRSLIEYCVDCRADFGQIHILYGAKNPDAVLFKGDLSVWSNVPGFSCTRTVDAVREGDCFSGSVGLITNLLPDLDIEPRRTRAAVVGPPAMYRPVIAALQEKGLTSRQIYLSLERQMRCGVGKCGHCSIEHLYCCQDGPVFCLAEVEKLKGAL